MQLELYSAWDVPEGKEVTEDDVKSILPDNGMYAGMITRYLYN